VNDILDQILSNPIGPAIGTAIGAALVALWLAVAWWAYADASRRTGSIPAALLAAAWIIASTPLLVPLSLPIYTLVRPHDSAAERRTRRLAAELADVLEQTAAPRCLGCGRDVDPAWQRCPSCAAWLALPCAACAAWSDRTLAVCPYCGAEERTEPAMQPLEPAPVESRQRGSRRLARVAAPGRHQVPRASARRAAPDGRPLAPVRVG